MAAAITAAHQQGVCRHAVRAADGQRATMIKQKHCCFQPLLLQPSTSMQWSGQQHWSRHWRRSRVAAAEQQAQQVARDEQQLQQGAADEQPQQPIRVAVGSTASGVARSLVWRLEEAGCAEVWASSAANHFTALQALAEAHRLLQEQRQAGLAASMSLSSSDQPVANDQKRSLKKLTLVVELTEPVDAATWAPPGASSSSRISTNRTQQVGQVLELLQQKLGEPDGASGHDDDGAAAEAAAASVMVEARGEQAVSRALKAALALQASAGRALLVAPWRGEVVDIVAEKRVQARTAGGLLLLLRWAPREQGPQ